MDIICENQRDHEENNAPVIYRRLIQKFLFLFCITQQYIRQIISSFTVFKAFW